MAYRLFEINDDDYAGWLSTAYLQMDRKTPLFDNNWRSELSLARKKFVNNVVYGDQADRVSINDGGEEMG